MSEHDEVNKPDHYQLFADGGQPIDVIESFLQRDEYIGFLKGNILKYRLRAGKKGDPKICLAKSEWYTDRLRKLYE